MFIALFRCNTEDLPLGVCPTREAAEHLCRQAHAAREADPALANVRDVFRTDVGFYCCTAIVECDTDTGRPVRLTIVTENEE